MTLTVSGHIICAIPAEAERVQAHLPRHIELTRAEPGCIRFNVTPTADPLVWHLDEEFTDAAAFKAHQDRMATTIWAEQTRGIKRDFKVSEA